MPRGWRNLGGIVAHHSRPLGNWESDEAIDMGAPPGTPVYACADGAIDPSAGFGFVTNGSTVWGCRLTLAADDGRAFFYTHLGGYAKGIRPGAQVELGQTVGWLGRPPGFAPHLHFAARPPTNPELIAYGHDRTSVPRPSTPEEKLRSRDGYWAWAQWSLGEGDWKRYGRRNPRVRPHVPSRVPRAWLRQLALLIAHRHRSVRR